MKPGNQILDSRLRGNDSRARRGRPYEILCLLAGLVAAACASAPSVPNPEATRFEITHTLGLDHALMETALGISEKLIQSKGQWLVAVTNLTNSSGKVTAFGEYVGNSLDARLAGSNIRLVDRAFARQISEELILCSQKGEIQSCSSMGKFKGANLLVVGRYEVFEANIRLFIKAIETETAEVLSAKEVAIPKDAFARELLARSGEAVSPAAEQSARKAKWRKRWLWTAGVTAVAGAVGLGVWAASRAERGSSSSGTVSAGGEGETATIVISVPPPTMRR